MNQLIQLRHMLWCSILIGNEGMFAAFVGPQLTSESSKKRSICGHRLCLGLTSGHRANETGAKPC